MEPVTIDYEENKEEIRYGKFGRRLGALVVDGLVVGIPLGIVSWYNQSEMKSAALLIVLLLLQMAYKPLLEFLYGTTLGKMAAGIRVVNEQMQKPTFGEALIRNIFAIVYTLGTLYFTAEAYADPDFVSANGWQESAVTLAKAQGQTNTYLSYAYYAIILVDLIVMLTNNKAQSLHDKMAGTFVIRTSKAAA